MLLKEWNQNQFANIHNNIARIEKDLNDFDKKKKEMTLTIEEMEAKRKLQDFWSNAMYRESLLKQKSRIKWLKEGAWNTKTFHIVVN